MVMPSGSSGQPDAADQLRELQEEAELQARTMSFVSHDLRGNLNGVVLMLEVLRRELAQRPELAESLEDLTLVRQSIQETVQLLERHSLLDKLQRRRVPVAIQPVNLKDVVDEVIARFAEIAKAKEMQLAADVDPQASVLADRFLLGTAISELLENAVKYGAGPIAITARLGGDNGKQRWKLGITDSGPGIAPDRLQMLMEPLQRLEKKERGLGLMIVHSAARLLGARLEAESSPAGSTFRLVLPSAG